MKFQGGNERQKCSKYLDQQNAVAQLRELWKIQGEIDDSLEVKSTSFVTKHVPGNNRKTPAEVFELVRILLRICPFSLKSANEFLKKGNKRSLLTNPPRNFSTLLLEISNSKAYSILIKRIYSCFLFLFFLPVLLPAESFVHSILKIQIKRKKEKYVIFRYFDLPRIPHDIPLGP